MPRTGLRDSRTGRAGGEASARGSSVVGTSRPARQQDPAVSALLKSAQRWLARGAVRVELPDEARYRPRILARPNAHDWVQKGGVVYPWDA
jgi:hypothetical protein